MSRYGWWMALCTALLCLGCVGSRSGDTGGDDDDSGIPVMSQNSIGPISRPGPAEGARFRARRWRSSTLVSVTS